MDNTNTLVISLVRKAVNPDYLIDKAVFAAADWSEVIAVCANQGLLGLCFEAIETLEEHRPPRPVLMRWIGELVNLENTYRIHSLALEHLAELYREEDIKLLLLKGYGLSLYWPKPNHRPCGDIDSYNFGKHDLADTIISQKYGIKPDNSHHKHSVFTFEGVMVENHYKFLNTVAHRSTAEIEGILEKEIQSGCSEDKQIKNLYYPSTKFNSLYLLRHSAEHFASVEISLRQVLDWGFFVQSNNVDWEWLLKQLDVVGMKTYLAVLNTICIDYLEFDSTLFPELDVDKKIVERCLHDIIHPEVKKERYRNPVKELLFRLRRWNSNRWKHDIVYKESAWQSFLTQTLSHILKPSL